MKLNRMLVAAFAASVSVTSSFMPLAALAQAPMTVIDLDQRRTVVRFPTGDNPGFADLCAGADRDGSPFDWTGVSHVANGWYGANLQQVCERMGRTYARYVHQNRLDGGRSPVEFTNFILAVTQKVARHWNNRMWRGEDYYIGTVEGLVQDGIPLLRMSWVDRGTGQQMFADYIMQTGSVVHQGRRYEGLVRFMIVDAGLGSSIGNRPGAEPPLTAFNPDTGQPFTTRERVAAWFEGLTTDQILSLLDLGAYSIQTLPHPLAQRIGRLWLGSRALQQRYPGLRTDISRMEAEGQLGGSTRTPQEAPPRQPGRTNVPGHADDARVPVESRDRMGHIFKDQEGHFRSPTPENIQALQSVARNPANYVGTTRAGNRVYARTNPDGTQTWAEVRGNTIVNGGQNQTGLHRAWDPNRQSFDDPNRSYPPSR